MAAKELEPKVPKPVAKAQPAIGAKTGTTMHQGQAKGARASREGPQAKQAEKAKAGKRRAEGGTETSKAKKPATRASLPVRLTRSSAK